MVESDFDKELPQFEQKESIKLIKNSRGYGWEIKSLSLDVELIDKINNEMIKRFGGSE